MSATFPTTVRCPACGAPVGTGGLAPGSRVTCGACRRPLVLPMSPAPTAATSSGRGGPLPPHLMGLGSPTASAAMAPVQPVTTPVISVGPPPADDTPAVPRPWIYDWLLVGGLGLGALVALAFVIALVASGGFVASRRGTGEQSETLVILEQEQQAEKWTDASKLAQALYKISVKIEYFEVGPVLTRNERGMAQPADDKTYLQIKLKLKNNTKQVLEYHSWYGNQFDVEGQIQQAELVDDQGQVYPRHVFESAGEIRGQAQDQNLDHLGSVSDVIVFAIPEGADVKTAKYFRLKLPLAAVGKEGWFRFELPHAMLDL